MRVNILVFLLCLLFERAGAFASMEESPALYRGRYRPAETVARLWLEEFEGKFQREDPLLSALKIETMDDKALKEAPLLNVSNRTLQERLGIPGEFYVSWNRLQTLIIEDHKIAREFLAPIISQAYAKSFFSDNNWAKRTKLELSELSPGLWVRIDGGELRINKTPSNTIWSILPPSSFIDTWPPTEFTNQIIESTQKLLERYLFLSQLISSDEENYRQLLAELSERKLTTEEKAAVLEGNLPLKKRLEGKGSLLLQLPDRHNPAKWYGLSALDLTNYNPLTDRLEPIKNFTAYKDSSFIAIQDAYKSLKVAIAQGERGEAEREWLGTALLLAYEDIAPTFSPTINLPSRYQLWAELFYTRIPLVLMAALLYLAAAIILLLRWRSLGISLASSAWSLHTVLLLLRIYILERPPVATMQETLLFVPWVAFSAVPLLFYRSLNTALTAGSIIALACLGFSLLNPNSSQLENVQAVLNSHYWLTIHVLMVVASYGLFLLAALTAHAYLISTITSRAIRAKEHLHAITLKSICCGLALLVPGTILGGIWAAQSWGRFWDWDPKESWAFITCCTYLLSLHAYYYGIIGPFGLAIGAIVGAWSTCFTWYGVNYLLGTGLHSYGFGNGTVLPYALAMAIDIAIVLYILMMSRLKLKTKSNSQKQPSLL